MSDEPLTTMQKAFNLNMDLAKYGTIAEIGAGQEVSRFFFRAGGAAGTIAKTISAYDMDFSDAIYGKEEDHRYVTESRVKKMLDKEFRLVLERVGDKRPKNSTYFAFADTITAKSYSQKSECHGWLGIKLQLSSGAEPCEILLHVRMLDESNLMQQEAVGILGVNLIYGAFYYYTAIENLIRSLGDNLEWGRLEIDLIRFTGPYFKDVNNRLMALKLVEMELSDAVVFATDRKTLVHPSELFYKRDVMVMRSMFKPVTNVSEDMMNGGMALFLRTLGVDVKMAMAVPEISIAEMRKLGTFDMRDILDRVDCLNLLSYPVIVSNYLRFFRVRAYLGRYTKGKVAFVLGIPNLTTLFDAAYYEGLKGGILGAFASLFDRETLLFVYPMRNPDDPEQIITAETFPVPELLKFFYYYLQANHMILPVERYNEANMHIWPEDILEQIKKGRGGWETSVPEVVAEEIISRGLFGFDTGC
ncbi:MAG: hypothetical protein PVI72_12340 [Desulfobacterales bacterium]|jgi:hypothetical protein